MTAQFRESSPHNTERIAGALRPIRRLPGVSGILVATTDGRSVVSDLTETTPGAAAAVTASSIGLAGRLADLAEQGASVLELQLRSEAGYVCLYAINDEHLLTVVCSHAVNLARLKLEVRDVLTALDAHLTIPPPTSPPPTIPPPTTLPPTIPARSTLYPTPPTHRN